MYSHSSIRKNCFTVVVGNPVESRYDRIIERYGGRIVGIHKEHTMLPDGRLYDEKMYEILRTDYMKHRKKLITPIRRFFIALKEVGER